jgi:hypothetical protein
MLTNHEDPGFVAERKNQLNNFIVAVANDGIIPDVPFVQSFLGFPRMSNVRAFRALVLFLAFLEL